MATRSVPLLTDEQLIELLKKGDRKAGDALVQEIFMKAFRKVNLYDPEQGKFTVWLTTVARHEAINHLRRMKRSRHVSLEDTAPEGGFAPIERPSQQVS